MFMRHVSGSRLASALLAAALAAAGNTEAAAQTYEPYDLTLPGQATIALDRGSLTGAPATITLTPEPSVVTVELGAGDNLQVTAEAVGDENVAVEYCDAGGNCEDAFFAFSVALARPITPSTVYDTITVGPDVYTYCVPTDELPGTPTGSTDICTGEAELFTEITLTEATGCLKYRGVTAGGSDTSCVVVCDDLGYCDTTTVVITTVEPNTYPDLEQEFVIFVGESGVAELDLSAFSATVQSIANDCENLSGTAVDFDVDAAAAEVAFYGLQVGEERACILVTDEAGRTQVTTVIVRVVPRPELTDTVRLRVGDQRDWCFDEVRLDQPPVEIADECPAGDAVASFTAATEVCAVIEGNAVGTRDVCVVVCDAAGACDRLALFVEVLAEDDDRLPDAVDDAYVVEPGATLSLEVLLNDLNLDGVDAVTIVREPGRGFARNASATVLEYTREEDDCRPDTLVYEICNAFGCDQAFVALTYECADRPEIEPMNGFSPNGDGVNESFFVRNIDLYPDNLVQVYNRWGNRVFEASTYRNDWPGTYDGKALPDGTYFYLIEVEGRSIAGSVHLRR